MNKIERRRMELAKHYETLEKLARRCGVVNPDGKKLSLKLWKLEQEAHKAATDYCNGDRFNGPIEDEWGDYSTEIEGRVNALFNYKLAGLNVNGDARGYALKIDDEEMRTNPLYKDIGIHQDWGGYGILSPEIE